MKKIKYITALLVLSCTLLGYSQTEPIVTVDEFDNATIDFFDEDGYLLYSKIVPNYSEVEQSDIVFDGAMDELGNEELIAEVSAPQNNKGILPLEYCYNPNFQKYYIFGERKVLVYNSTNNELIKDVFIGESINDNFWAYPTCPKMVFSTNPDVNKLYCITPDNNFIIINGENDQIEYNYDMGDYYSHIFRSIYIDKFTDNIYITLDIRSGIDQTLMFKFSQNGDLIDQHTYNFIIRDLKCINSNKIYVSGPIGIHSINSNDITEIQEVQSGFFTDIGFAENENKIYGCDRNTLSIYAINTISDEIWGTVFTNTDFKYLFDTEYNPVDKRIYAIGYDAYNVNRLIAIDTDLDYGIYTYANSAPIGLLWVNDGSLNNLYVRTPSTLIYFSGDDSGSPNGYLSQYNGYGKALGYNPDLNQVVAINSSSNHFTIQNPILMNIISAEHTGGYITRVAYNTENNKIYALDAQLQDDLTWVSVYDGTSFEFIKRIEVGYNANNLIYSEANNKVYVRHSSFVTIIDGETDEIEETISLGYNGLSRPLLVNNTHLFATGSSNIIKIDLANNAYQVLDCPYSYIQKMVFGKNGEIYILSKGNGWNNYVTKLNYSSGNVEWSKQVNFGSFIAYNENDNTLCTAIGNYVVNLDGNNGEILNEYFIGPNETRQGIYSPSDNSIVFVNGVLGSKGLIKLNATDLSPIKSIGIPTARYKSLILNQSNTKIYLHATKAGSDLKAKLLSFHLKDLDPMGITNLGPQFSTSDRMHEITPIYNYSMVLNSNSNQIIVPNSIFSTFSVVQCPEEERTFKNGWNWVSFPKLERTNDDPVELAPLLNTMEPMPDYMKVWHRLNTNGDMTWAEYDDEDNWVFENLDELQSTKGYKIEITDGEDEFQLTTPGTRLAPDYPIMLAGDMVENWIGYYEYQQADPFDALAYCIDNLRVIKGQHWSAYWEVIYIDKGSPVYGWFMSKPYPLKYGDMLIVQGINDCELIWNQSPKAGGKEKAEAIYFDYQEQADYTSVFIELDQDSDATEIGAFVGGSCVGAAVVETGDSLVEIQAYLQGAEGDELYFETHSANKSAPAERPDYYVKDFNSMQYVNRKIRPYDKKPFHLVSFKDHTEEMADAFVVYHYPNPAIDQLNLHFNLPEETAVSIQLIDVNGKVLDENELGNYPLGSHDYNFTLPADLSSGVYLYKLITNKTTIVNQLVIQ
jgi:hypothetical protein